MSAFNALIANCKITKYDLNNVQNEIIRITKALQAFLYNSRTLEFEEKLLQALYEFNNKYFPVPEYKYKVKRRLINEDQYGAEKEKEFLFIFNKLVKQYDVSLRQVDRACSFLDKWYSQHIRGEIQFVFDEINKINDTWRIAYRLGWNEKHCNSKKCTAKDMDFLQELIPPRKRFSLHVNMVSHGRKICTARYPKCDVCTINRYCPKIGV